MDVLGGAVHKNASLLGNLIEIPRDVPQLANAAVAQCFRCLRVFFKAFCLEEDEGDRALRHDSMVWLDVPQGTKTYYRQSKLQ